MIHASFALALALGARSVCAQDRPDAPPQILDRQSVQNLDILKTYEIRDMLPPVPHAEDKTPGGAPTLRGEEYEHEVLLARQPTLDFLTELITREVQPASDPDTWKIRITPSGTLVLHARAAQHDWVQAFLEANHSSEQMVFVESRWIEGPKGSFQHMGFPGGVSATVLEAKDRSRLLALDKDDARYEIRTAPRMLVNPVQAATIYVGESLAYVKSYKVETVQPGAVKIADPEIAHVDEGMELRARVLLIDAQRLAVDLEASTTAVRTPIPTHALRLAGIEGEFTVAEPEVDRRSIKARCTLASDATVAFCVPCAGKDDREIMVLLSARKISPAELKEMSKPR